MKKFSVIAVILCGLTLLASPLWAEENRNRIFIEGEEFLIPSHYPVGIGDTESSRIQFVLNYNNFQMVQGEEATDEDRKNRIHVVVGGYKNARSWENQKKQWEKIRHDFSGDCQPASILDKTYRQCMYDHESKRDKAPQYIFQLEDAKSQDILVSLRCGIPSQLNPDSHLNYQCGGRYVVFDGVDVYYFYSVDHMLDAALIHNMIDRIIKSFHQMKPKGG